jgi:chromosome segregation ATPase
MNRPSRLVVALLLISCPYTVSQTTPTDSQTLQAILVELRQLRHDLQTTSAMAARAQIALYRLQREDEAVARATQRVGDARTRLHQLGEDRDRKASDIEADTAAANHSDRPEFKQAFDEVELPRLKAELELLQKQERQARDEQAEAEQQLRDEQAKLDELDNLLNRYNAALEGVGQK